MSEKSVIKNRTVGVRNLLLNKGFTLIELLAVIVILAIIALIATPIVLEIIENSKESSSIRSAENYLSAVEQSIARGQLSNNVVPSGTYTIIKGGNICLVETDGTTCLDGDTLKVQINGEAPDSGTITIIDGEIKNYRNIFIGGKYISKGLNSSEITNNYKPICQAVMEATTGTPPSETEGYVSGDEYICEVKPGISYTFLVLSTSGDKINLIMNKNINSKGEEITTDDKGKIAWITKADYKKANIDNTSCPSSSCADEGPITALNFLYEATDDWLNISYLNEYYTDEGNRYGTILLNGRTRLPKKSEANSLGCSPVSNSCPAWFVSNFDIVDGFHTLSSTTSYSFGVWVVRGTTISDGPVTYTESYGVRPVITVSKSDIKE